jgi:hypothetical protein
MIRGEGAGPRRAGFAAAVPETSLGPGSEIRYGGALKIVINLTS